MQKNLTEKPGREKKRIFEDDKYKNVNWGLLKNQVKC